MLRAQLRRVTSSSTPRRLIRGHSFVNRRFGSQAAVEGQLPRPPILRPILWTLAATTIIFTGSAAYDVRQDIKNVRRKGLFKEGESIRSYDDLEDAVHRRGGIRHFLHRESRHPKWNPPGQIGQVLAGYSDTEKVTLGALALNISIFGASHLSPPAFASLFAHTPVMGTNYTLLTAAFGHVGFLHLAFNSLALYNCAPIVAQSPVFQGNGSHFAAFYLSTGIFANLSHHLGTMLPTRRYWVSRFGATQGASGVIMAMFGVLAMLYPDARVGIMFLPGTYSIENLVASLVVFDAVGLFVGIPYLNFAHAAHLGGLAAGAAYAYFDGRRRLWIPSRRLAFNGMKLLKMT
ncbi:hypothetical protein M426DRAFT_318428 [Hypoxylon sp. CI-4A]|nr:hypothetical protein M426DRAFT_318428 [Hypoxylon sp. CI-4A]